MKERVFLILITCGLFVSLGCRTIHDDDLEVRLSLPRGDFERGEEVFKEMKCYACHEITRADMPATYAKPPVPIMLGAERQRPTREQLVNSIVNPSHRFEPAQVPGVTTSGQSSRMGDYNDVLTVRQLSDLVAFLRSVSEY